jgi:hypothetical protein
MNKHPPSDFSPLQDDRVPRGVGCVGLYSSASTWAFNVTASLLRLADGGGVVPFYGDDIDEIALRKIERSNSFVLKSHLPGPSVRALCEIGRLPVLLTVRDPRDAVVSLMQRFGQDFGAALDRVERSANLVLHLSERIEPLVLRYEDGFAGLDGITSIATHLGFALSASDRQKINDGLSPDAVAQRLQDLQTCGIFEGGNAAEQWEASTQWHPSHIGDGRIGKYRDLLTTTESEKVAYATRPFFMAFGYGTNRSEHPELPPASGSIAEPSMEGWIDHFVPPDLVSGWARLLGSSRRLELQAHHEGQVVGRTLADLRRADLTGFGDSDVGFQLRLSMPVTLGELIGSVAICATGNGSEFGRIKPTAELIARTQPIRPSDRDVL